MSTDDEREEMLPGLRRFGDELTRAAERRVTRQTRRGHIGRPVVVMAVLFLLIVGGAGAAVLLSVGEPVKTRTDAPPHSAPGAAPQIAVTAADPDGIVPWAARIYSTSDDSECVVAGRLKGGQLGQLDGRRFHPLPSGAYGACGRLTPRRFFFTAGPAPGEPSRSLVYGRAGTAVKALSVRTPHGEQRVPLGAGGAFLLVFAGSLDSKDVQLQPLY